MFISVTQFERSMGVNRTIGSFFVDRKPPGNNSFWAGRLLYIGMGNGYVSIPVYYDLLYRIGLSIHDLLDEDHIQCMEGIMHFAILHEKNKISSAEQLNSIRALIQEKILHVSIYEKLNAYLNQTVLKPLDPFGLPHPSLNRADVFLYILCILPMDETQMQSAIHYWYRLHPSYLILDDIRDYTADVKNGEDNIVVDFGGGPAGFEKAFDMLRENGNAIQKINPALGQFLLDYENEMRVYVPQTV